MIEKNLLDRKGIIFLNESKADLNLTTTGSNALHFLIQKKNLDAVTALIEAKADLNIRDFEEKTPLHIAALVGDIDIIRTLIRAGAKGIKDSNQFGDNALDLAIIANHMDIIDILIALSGSHVSKNSLNKAIRRGRIEIAKKLSDMLDESPYFYYDVVSNECYNLLPVGLRLL